MTDFGSPSVSLIPVKLLLVTLLELIQKCKVLLLHPSHPIPPSGLPPSLPPFDSFRVCAVLCHGVNSPLYFSKTEQGSHTRTLFRFRLRCATSTEYRPSILIGYFRSLFFLFRSSIRRILSIDIGRNFTVRLGQLSVPPDGVIPEFITLDGDAQHPMCSTSPPPPPPTPPPSPPPRRRDVAYGFPEKES